MSIAYLYLRHKSLILTFYVFGVCRYHPMPIIAKMGQNIESMSYTMK